MNTIGLLNEFANSPEANLYFSTVLHGILFACNAARQGTLILSEHSWEEMSANQSLYCDGRCDGFLMLATPSINPLYEAFQQSGIPVVVIGDLLPDLDISCIDVDNLGAADQAVTYLVGQGHRRIAILCGDFAAGSARLRLDGYRLALARADIECDESLVLPGGYYPQSGYERARLLMQRPPEFRPTALFCSNDGIALGALNALNELGVAIPDEISVFGFDDIPSAQTARPPLTPMRQPLSRIGVRATEILLEQIRGGKSSGQKEVLLTELIIRNTVAPL